MDKALNSLYDLSFTESERENSWNKNRLDSKKILSEYELDAVEQTVVWVAGILAGVVDAFFITDVRRLDKNNKMMIRDKDGNSIHLNESGKVNSWIDKRIKNIYSPEQIAQLEQNNWVPYDASSDKDIVGLGPRTHRLQSFGHDPLLGFYYGVRDIMNGTITAVDNSGTVIVKKMSDGGVGLFEAIATQFGHLKSDLCTPAGLPIPFMGQLMRMSGNSDINGLSFQMLFKGMYMKGYNLNHLITMGIPALIIEVVIRVSYFAYQLYQGKTFQEALPINKAKVDKMLFQSYLITTACNGIKMFVSHGNIFAFNPTLWSMSLKYGLSEVKRWVNNEKETKRHEYVAALYDKRIEELDAIIEKDIQFYM